MICVQKPACLNYQPDTMAGGYDPQSIPRTQAAARYISFPSFLLFFLLFLRRVAVARTSCKCLNLFVCFDRNIPGFLSHWTPQDIFPHSQGWAHHGGFFFVFQSRLSCPSHVCLPTPEWKISMIQLYLCTAAPCAGLVSITPALSGLHFIMASLPHPGIFHMVSRGVVSILVIIGSPSRCGPVTDSWLCITCSGLSVCSTDRDVGL